jgi:hypothetical protein
MRAIFGLAGLIVTVVVVMFLTGQRARAPVAVPAATPGHSTTVVPMTQAPSQVQADMNALTQQQSQQMQQSMQQLGNNPTAPAGER